MTRRPEDIAAFILLANGEDLELRDALTTAAATYLDPRDVVDLVRLLSFSAVPSLIGSLLEQVLEADGDEWAEAVAEELDTWNAVGEATYLRRRVAGDTPEQALRSTRDLQWTLSSPPTASRKT